MNIRKDRLESLVVSIFSRIGSNDAEARTVARHLVAANLAGYESHGVILIPYFIEYVREGTLLVNQRISVVFENDSIAIVDGNFGFGHVVAEQATDLGIEKAREKGVAVVGLRNSGHVGRLGDWARQAAKARQVSLHFVNSSGFGILTAPFGGSDRRLSSNPIAAGVPVEGKRPIILDISTSVLAAGKILVARNKGERLPEGAIIDAQGKPSTDPHAFDADPPGALLPFAGHKGYGLSVICEVFAGAITGSGCSNPTNPTADRFVQGMCSIFIDPAVFTDAAEFSEEIKHFIAWVKGSPPREPGGEVLMPGETEGRTTAHRLTEGIPLDEITWNQVVDAGESVGLARHELEAMTARGGPR